MTLSFDTPDGPLALDPARCVVAGWTGRNADAVRHHIEELEAIGVPAPSRTPLPYEVSPALLTQGDTIHCVGAETSGEAEPAVLFAGGRRYLTLASDHTDRALETRSVALSKQVCAKPIAREAWPLDEIIERTDALRMAAHIDEDRDWVPYQRGRLSTLLPLTAIIEASGLDGSEDAVLLCGTLPALGGVRPAARIRMMLNDPKADRTIELAYTTRTLPEVA